MASRPLVDVMISIELTGAEKAEEGMVMSTDMSIEIRKASEDVPAKVALGAAIGGLKAALEQCEKQWDKDYGDNSAKVKVYDITEVSRGRA